MMRLKHRGYAHSSWKYRLLRAFTMLTVSAVYLFTGSVAGVCYRIHVFSWVLILAILLTIACTGLAFKTFGDIWKEG